MVMRRLLRGALGVVLAMAALMVSGVYLADWLTPPNTGAPSTVLPVAADETPLDRALVALLERRPGQSGAVMLADGMEAFAARATLARQAGRSLDVQYYIWRDDLIGHLLLFELWQAAGRGVRVRLLLDDVNTAGKDVALLALANHPNLEIRVYNPFRNRSGVRRVLEMIQRAFSMNHRMHNKSWTADGRATIVGGRNIGNEYFAAATETNFRDLDLFVVGPAADDAGRIFDRYWNSPAVVPIDALQRGSGDKLPAVLETIRREATNDVARQYLQRVIDSPGVRRYVDGEVAMLWSDTIAVVSDPPDKRPDRRSEPPDDDRADWLYRRVPADLDRAEQEVLVISPYFVPGPAGPAQLAKVRRREGGRVSIVTNSLAATDVLAVHSGYRRYRPMLLRHGIELFEVRALVDADPGLFGSSAASLHTKAWLVDGRRGFIGSFNMDPRSALLNTEMGVVFDDPDLGRALRAEFEQLASPAFSYRVFLDANGQLRWREAVDGRERIHEAEPDATLWQRLLVVVLGWLPIESQL